MKNALSEDVLRFLNASPTPFHAVAQMVQALQGAGFESLSEADAWQLRPGGRYVVTRNDASLVAFVVGMQAPVGSGIRMVGAHTDSPCLKIKPQPELVRQGYFQLGVEVYGGVLLAPWFDRDLSIAGRVHYRDSAGSIKAVLIDFKKPVAVIPSLAIHLDREANNKRCINAQTDLPPVLMHASGDKPDFREMLLAEIKLQDTGASAVLDYELALYDTQQPALIGWHDEFIAGARLDNLLSCYIGLQALLTAGTDTSVVLVCNDHEEVGSMSCSGARGPFLRTVLQRWLGHGEEYARAIDRSILISADNAHGIHPNFSDKHDGNHGPLLNAGPVIKVNANQGYASSSETQAFFRQLCAAEGVPVQMFVARTDVGCGSTIGPLTAAEVGIKTVDVGVPTFAMHSIRELAGVQDVKSLLQVLVAFFGASYASQVTHS